MSKPNAFQLMMKATQPSDKKTKSGFAIIKGSDKIQEESCYLLQFDGLSEPNPGTSTAGAVLFSPALRTVVFERGEFIEFATNNQAEYTGLIIGVKAAFEMGIKQLLIEGDSQLVVLQTEGKWKVKNDALKAINTEVRGLLSNFDFVAIRHIYREKNEHADRITNDVLKTRKSFFRKL
jgi:ribonuclease HI